VANTSFIVRYDARFTINKPTTPAVVVTNANNETNTKAVPSAALDENGYLLEEMRLSLPANWFTRGENELRVVSANGGTVVTTINATTESAGALWLSESESGD
jgi:hypothetical protein